jgi:hypothetical protein
MLHRARNVVDAGGGNRFTLLACRDVILAAFPRYATLHLRFNHGELAHLIMVATTPLVIS